ncbi:MotA/TolQ/ExbB proton channel family protein [bacterium]|nr:MotA/TolQ/ExbB proton channel family protein [bacterium]NIN91555.1 MotA/TolQ/ExbB proton channel family protein [bacterium]NIO18968.1 MotA/TolQ/ExbB proton channel family protein [bacterium]NIO74080.1 MotA/TolQ/ExbB proton channel family protein [bacterium]
MLNYFFRGGIMMYPLFLASVLALAIIINKFQVLSRARTGERELMGRIKGLVDQKRVEQAVAVCDNSKGAVASILRAGLSQHAKGQKAMEDAFEAQASEEVPRLESYLPALATIAAVSTLMGFTGTVIGMIRAFDSIAAASATSPAIVASGISEALITTATGLLIAIPTLLFYRYFVHRVDRFVSEIERYCKELVRILIPG